MKRAATPEAGKQAASSSTSSQMLPPRIYSASELFGAAREVGIQHDGALYRLQITRLGKLILTK